jgi:hypothetical protein
MADFSGTGSQRLPSGASFAIEPRRETGGDLTIGPATLGPTPRITSAEPVTGMPTAFGFVYANR